MTTTDIPRGARAGRDAQIRRGVAGGPEHPQPATATPSPSLSAPAAGTDLPGGQRAPDTHEICAAGEQTYPGPAMARPEPKGNTPGRGSPDVHSGHSTLATHPRSAAVDPRADRSNQTDPDPTSGLATPNERPSGRGPEDPHGGRNTPDTHWGRAAVDPDPRDDQENTDAHHRCVVAGPMQPPAELNAVPKQPPPAAPHIPGDHACVGALCSSVAGEWTQPATDVDAISNPGTSLAGKSTRSGQGMYGAQVAHAAAGQAARPATEIHTTPMTGSLLAEPFLYLAAQAVDDLERLRKASENRLRILTTPADQPDKDGHYRGFGLDERHPAAATQAALVESVAKLEHQAVLELQRRVRKHPLSPWGKAQRGIGEKQLARLLAAIGDPYWNTLHNRPRTVSELWAYCGYRPGQKRQRGVKANWSADAKTRAYLIAESCMKAGGPYRGVYDQRRAHTARTHPAWTDGHSHTDGLRVAAKAILRDLWRGAARIHGTPEQEASE